MASEKYLLFSLDDEKSKKLGEVISSSMCKKIVNLLAESELSETEISKELKVPINTVEYNLRKLIEAGMIERAKHWWSVKGKKIDTYKVANKLIVISPRKSVVGKLKSIVPVALISGIFIGIVAWYYNSGVQVFAKNEFDRVAESGASGVLTASSGASMANSVAQTITFTNAWEWFLIGSISTIILFLILNWRKL